MSNTVLPSAFNSKSNFKAQGKEKKQEPLEIIINHSRLLFWKNNINARIN